jgi:hypothetical protein
MILQGGWDPAQKESFQAKRIPFNQKKLHQNKASGIVCCFMDKPYGRIPIEGHGRHIREALEQMRRIPAVSWKRTIQPNATFVCASRFVVR